MSADDLLGVAIIPLSHLLFAEDIDPFAGVWPPAPVSGGPVRVQALFRAPIVLSGIHRGFLRGKLALSPDVQVPLKNFWAGRGLKLR